MIDTDLVPCQSHTETGRSLYSLPLSAKCNSLAWHPSRNYLAYSTDESYGTVRVFGL